MKDYDPSWQGQAGKARGWRREAERLTAGTAVGRELRTIRWTYRSTAAAFLAAFLFFAWRKLAPGLFGYNYDRWWDIGYLLLFAACVQWAGDKHYNRRCRDLVFEHERGAVRPGPP